MYIKFGMFLKKLGPHSFSIFEIIHFEKPGYLNA